MSNFQDKVKKHFEIYETDEITSEVKYGVWRKETRNAHILQKDKESLNLLPTFRESILQMMERERVKPHMYFHHLNSSQAMCLNFFYPLIKERLRIILDAIDNTVEWGDIEKGVFEKKSDDEIELNRQFSGFGEPTNFDFYIKTTNGYEISFEIKYTEQEFATAKKEEGEFKATYDNKFEAYKSIMPECIKENTEKIDFLNHYQLMRNLLFLKNEKRYVVFLIPEDNQPVYNSAKSTTNWIREEMQSHVKVFGWKELFDVVAKAIAED